MVRECVFENTSYAPCWRTLNWVLSKGCFLLTSRFHAAHTKYQAALNRSLGGRDNQYLRWLDADSKVCFVNALRSKRYMSGT